MSSEDRKKVDQALGRIDRGEADEVRVSVNSKGVQVKVLRNVDHR